MIVETGFKLFIILKKYMEDVDEDGKKDDDDQEEDKEDGTELDVFKKEFNNILGENNIVGQISALGFDLLKVGLNAAESSFYLNY